MSVNFAAAPSREALHSSAVQFRPSLVLVAACFAVILFALVPATTRIAATQVCGLSIGLMRTVGAGCLSLPLLLVLRPRLPQKLKDWGLLLLCAFGNFAGFPILFGVGVQRTSGSHAALIMAAMPLFIGLIGMLLERRLPRWIWFIGAAIAVGGESALVGIGNMNNSAGASAAGDSIVLAACTLSAIGIVAGARLGSRMGPLAVTSWAIFIAGACLAPWAAIRVLAAPDAYQALSATTWAAVLQITLGAAVIANVSWLWAVSRGGLVRVAPIQFAQPVCALLFSSVLLNERLSTSLLLVAVSIVFGTIIACRGARPNPTKQGIGFARRQSRLQNTPALFVPAPDRIRALMGLVQEPVHAGPARMALENPELVPS
jgi:drug/metabolite transporter (DMT)-like permease